MSATIVSAQSTYATVTAAASGWWLKDPTNPTLNAQVYPVDPPQHVKTEQMQVHYPLGRTRPLITTDTVTGHDGTLKLLTTGPTAWQTLEALKNAQDTLLLQSPFGEQWYVRLVDDRQTTLQPSVLTGAYRETVIKYVEVDPPAVP